MLNKAVITEGNGTEQVSVALDGQLSEFLLKVIPNEAHKVGEQVPLIQKVLVKATPGNSGSPDNLVDRRLCKTGGGEFLPSRLQKTIPLFLRQAEEGVCAHMCSPLPEMT